MFVPDGPYMPSLISAGKARSLETMMIDYISMFVERKVCYSALFTNLVGWHASACLLYTSDAADE